MQEASYLFLCLSDHRNKSVGFFYFTFLLFTIGSDLEPTVFELDWWAEPTRTRTGDENFGIQRLRRITNTNDQPFSAANR